MAYEMPIFIKSFVAHVDLRTQQYRFVTQDPAVEGEVNAIAAATDVPVGVLQNAPNVGETAEVMMLGVTKLQADGIVGWGDLIGTSADGQADVKVPGVDIADFVVGRALEAAAGAGIIFTAAINCFSPHRAA